MYGVMRPVWAGGTRQVRMWRQMCEHAVMLRRAEYEHESRLNGRRGCRHTAAGMVRRDHDAPPRYDPLSMNARMYVSSLGA
eukprot:52990-Eustigmatos_ZCMA.PRE.1